MSIDHFYTASILGRGYGTRIFNKKNKPRRSRKWPVSVLNIQKLIEQIDQYQTQNPTETPEQLSQDFLTLPKTYLETESPDKIYSATTLIEPNNATTKNIEDLLNEAIDKTTSELTLNSGSYNVIYDFFKETISKSPILNEFDYTAYDSNQKKHHHDIFERVFPSASLTKISSFNVSDKGFLIDGAPMLFLNEEWWNTLSPTYFSKNLQDIAAIKTDTMFLWFYSKNDLIVINNNLNFNEAAFNNLLTEPNFYKTLYFQHTGHTMKYITCSHNRTDYDLFIYRYLVDAEFKQKLKLRIAAIQKIMHPKSK